MNLYLSKVALDKVPDKREKIIFLLTLVGFSFVFLKSCWFPSKMAMNTVRKEMVVIEEEMKEFPAVDAEIMKEIAKEEKVTRSSFPGEYLDWAKSISNATDSFIMGELSNPIVANGVEIVNLQFMETAKSEGVLKRSFSMSVYGPFSSVVRYVRGVESLQMLLIIDNISFEVVDDSLGRVNAEIGGAIYGWK